jgi:hypothetical protein
MGSPAHPPRKTGWNIAGYQPYAFKPFAMEQARKSGFDIIVWLDASMVVIRALDTLMYEVAEVGHWFPLDGWPTGEWCSDAALELLKITRDEAFQIPTLAAGAMALDLRHPWSSAFLSDWLELCRLGAFRGPWTNENHEASKHPRVRGHRHDMTCASVLAWRAHMKLTEQPKFYSVGDSKRPESFPEETVIVADGDY